MAISQRKLSIDGPGITPQGAAVVTGFEDHNVAKRSQRTSAGSYHIDEKRHKELQEGPLFSFASMKHIALTGEASPDAIIVLRQVLEVDLP